LHSWAILGTLALSETVPAEALQNLRDQVQPNGGWEWSPGWGADTNSTSLAIQALIAAGESPTSTLILNGLDFLKTAQNDDGGFTYDPNSAYGTDSDTNSTAYGLQAIRSAGQDPITGTWVISSTNPISYLLGMQLPDGSFEWQPGFGSNGLATQQAIPALLGRVFPIERGFVEGCPVSFLPIINNTFP
jgi:squalene cyclase